LHVLDHPRHALLPQPVPDRVDQLRVVGFVQAAGGGVCLARWAGVDGVEAPTPGGEEFERVGLVELVRVVRLWPVVDADDVEPGAVVADCGTTRATEQVEQLRPAHGGCCLPGSGSSEISHAPVTRPLCPQRGQ
jgi:hypothetical protein